MSNPRLELTAGRRGQGQEDESRLARRSSTAIR